MAKRSHGGITDKEFNARVDEGFQKPARPKKDRVHSWTWVPPDSLITTLEEEGADPRLSKSAARFHATLARCMGVTVTSPPSEQTVKFLTDFDTRASAFAKTRGLKLRD